jgi:hypothetical protein
MRCPHCGESIVPKNSMYEEEAHRILEELRRVPQPFRMNKPLKNQIRETLKLTPHELHCAWRLLREMNKLEKVSGYGPTTSWKVRDR